MTLKILGLDLSLTATGVARPDGALDTIRPNTKGDDRLDEITETLALDLLDIAGRGLVVVEDFVVRSSAASALGMLHGCVRRDMIRARIPYVAVPPATLKVFACGRGNATKPDMRVELLQRTRVDERDDNRVDAAWLRLLGHHFVGDPLIELPKTHTRALAKLPAVSIKERRLT